MGLSTHMKTFDEYIIESISREDIIARDLLKHKKTLGSKYSIALKHLNKGNLDQAQRFIDAIKEGTESLDEGTESLDEGTESLDEGTESLDEAKTMAQRLKMKQTFRKNKAKIALGRKKAGRKLADKDTLMKRARKHARDLLVKKLTKGKGKDELSFAQRQNIEKQVDKKKGAIDRIAKKLLPKLRQLDKDKLKKKKG